MSRMGHASATVETHGARPRADSATGGVRAVAPTSAARRVCVERSKSPGQACKLPVLR